MCDTGLAGMFKFLWLVSLTCKFCIQNTEKVKGSSIRGFNCSNCVANKRWNVRHWRGASVASVHLQFMLLSTSPRHCVYFEKPVVFALDSWRETSWWIAGGVKVSPTRGEHRNESTLFSYWALPSAAWHPSARCYRRLLGRQQVVHIKGPFHQILCGKTQIEAMFPLHMWQMLIELLKISGRGFLMNWMRDLSLVTKQKLAAWAGHQVPHFVNCFQHELKWCSSHGWDMSRSAFFSPIVSHVPVVSIIGIFKLEWPKTLKQTTFGIRRSWKLIRTLRSILHTGYHFPLCALTLSVNWFCTAFKWTFSFSMNPVHLLVLN